jgi:imidazolonepropionase-like amidohydrolase
VIDGTGKFLIPGLWDMHVHVVDPDMARLFLRYGVTGVRHMFSPLATANVRASDPAGYGAGPRVVAATHLLDGDRTVFKTFGLKLPTVVSASTAADGKTAARKMKELGNDFLKVHAHLPKAAYLAAVAEARAVGLTTCGHVPYEVSVIEASEAGQHTIEHLDGVAVACAESADRFAKQRRELAVTSAPHAQARIDLAAALDYHPERAAAVFKTFADKGTWHVPTLVQTRAVARAGTANAVDPKIEEELPQTVKLLWTRSLTKDGGVVVFGQKFTATDLADRGRQFAEEQKLVGRMHAAGVRLLAGTDTPYPLVVPGLALHDELELMVGAGLTPVEALRTATLNPARCLGREADLGSVAAGKYADLVLLAGDPTEDITNTQRIAAVLVGGKTVFR